MHRSNAEGTVVTQLQRAKLSVTDAHRILQHRLEHRLQLTGGAADDLEHVGGCGLLLKRFAQFVEQPRVLDRDDGCAAKFVTNSICLSVKGRTSWR